MMTFNYYLEEALLDYYDDNVHFMTNKDFLNIINNARELEQKNAALLRSSEMHW